MCGGLILTSRPNTVSLERLNAGMGTGDDFYLRALAVWESSFYLFWSSEPICLKHMLGLYFIFKNYREKMKE